MGILKKKSIVKLSSINYNQYFDHDMSGDIPLEHFKLGDLNLPTGEIVACDPFFLWDALPFNRTVKSGAYPVTACIAHTKDAGERYAFVKIDFSLERAVAWEMALIEGQDAGILKDDQFFGFGVDGGFGCFCDAGTQSAYNEWVDQLDAHGDNEYNNYIKPGLEKNAKTPGQFGDWLDFGIPSQPDLNVIMFSSGHGDGHYPCYWGINENGNICSLIVDLYVIGYDL